jgi:hypothetical protein
MTAPVAPTFHGIKALVDKIQEQKAEARVIGVRSPDRYEGPEIVADGEKRYRILQCDAPIQFRMALNDDPGNVSTTVLITPLEDRRLGEDIRVRLATRKLHAISRWHVVGWIFKAQRIDPRITAHGWIADRLMALVPPEGYPPVPGGVLDADTVWDILLRRELGMTSGRPDLAALLKWSAHETRPARWREADERFRTEAAAWIAQTTGPAGDAVLNCVMAARESLALPAGLAMGVIYAEAGGPKGKLDKAAGKLEQMTGNADIPLPIARRWYGAAVEVIRHGLTDPKQHHAWLEQSDEVLQAVGATDFAHLSDISPLGLEQRLSRFGEALDRALSRPKIQVDPALLNARDRVLAHDLAKNGTSRRLERVAMAIRLLRWLEHQTRNRSSRYRDFTEATADYVRHGGFVDWARNLISGGEPVKALQRAYGRLGKAVAKLREQQNQAFAELLRDWTEAGSAGEAVLPIENVIDRIIAPVIRDTPLLLILIDGMSYAVFQELMVDITAREWSDLGRADGSSLSPVLAAIPSVTRFSRTSLFSGKRVEGGAPEERKGFENHPALKTAAGQPAGATLFHKVAVTDAGDGSLAEEVRDALASPAHRIVGVVLNAVDDHLNKGDQTDPKWTMDYLRAMPALLYEARTSGRAVLLISDHGHVLEWGTKLKPDGEGERWRSATKTAEDGEMTISGGRVMGTADGRLIGLWSEQYRYGAKMNGYHGGLTPQEMLAPMALLAADDKAVPKGWELGARYVPSWWEDPVAETAIPADLPSAPVPKGAPPKKGQLLLFDTESQTTPASKKPAKPIAQSAAGEQTPPSHEWIEALTTSDMYQSQKAIAGRAMPDDKTIQTFIETLVKRGGRITSPAL